MNIKDPNQLNKLDARSQDITFFEYLYVLVLIIYGGFASSFVRSFSLDKPLAILLPILMSVILALRSKIVFNKQIYILLMSYILYNFAITIKFGEIHPVFFGYMFVNFLVTYITVKALRFRIFIIYEHLIYYLTIIGLGMWVIQLMLGGDKLFDFIGRIPSIDTFSNVTGGGLNIIFYSVQPFIQTIVSFSPIPRNCGFAWEPGSFAAFLCFAIFINLFFIKSKKKLNTRFWIFVLGLLSTQSTTGYVIFIIIMIFYFLQENLKIILLFFPILIISVVLFFSLPFMMNKIRIMYEEAYKVDMIVEESIGRENARNPQRFASFVITIKDFIKNPIFGYGGQIEERWYSKINANIAPISGIGNLLAQYGLVGFIFFITLLINSSRSFSRYYHYRGEYLFVLLVVLITISYALIQRPIIMSFWMYSFFENCYLPADTTDKV